MARPADKVYTPERKDETRPQAPRRGLGMKALTAIRHTISYIILGFGAVFMLFPVFWMVTAALKPEWQIFTRPVIWVPQHWHKVEAGDTVRLLNLYHTPDPDGGERLEVLELGARRYTTAISADAITNLISAPRDEVGEAATRRISGALVNVRKWNGQDVVAIGRDGDNLLLLPLSAVANLEVMPLDVLNSGARERLEIEGHTLQFRVLEEDVGSTAYLALGPQTQRKTVMTSEVAGEALLVPRERLGASDDLPLADALAEQYTLVDNPDGRYLLLREEFWRPTIDLEILRQHAFTIPEEEFVADEEPGVFNLGLFPVGDYRTEGGVQRVALIFREAIQTQNTVLVMPVEQMDQVIMVPAASLQRPFAETIDETPVRFKNFTLPTVKDETIDMDALADRVALLGERQNMALILPTEAVQIAFDTPGQRVSRLTSIAFVWKNFPDAMTRKIANANFLTFFKNSIIVTGLSILGHLLSVTVVAYAFARMRAPGKNALFLVVLATMMLPEFVTLIPVYKIFRDLGMVDSLTPLWIRSFFGNAFLIFLLRQFFSTIPRDLEDAAIIDGATRVQTFIRVMLPLITPALATVIIFTFLWRWNDLFQAAIYLNSPENYTVAIGLNAFLGAFEAEFTLLMAASTVVMLPTVLLFFFAQRFFIEGITLTGVKG